jgi:23S rRNA (guanosine2251-2'-O)-methyltransferase
VASKLLTGFHAIEERIRRLAEQQTAPQPAALNGVKLWYAKTGPRVKRILGYAREAGIPSQEISPAELDRLASALSAAAQDHRGVILELSGAAAGGPDMADLEQFIAALRPDESAVVVALDSITDPRNVGAIIRSCDQFGVSLVVTPKRRGLSGAADNEIVSRTSAGAAAWVPVCETANLTQSALRLKEAGFWVYGADAKGTAIHKIAFAPRCVLALGSEGNGISRLLAKHCDALAAIPAKGGIDSLNVSVAAGILLYEIARQRSFV